MSRSNRRVFIVVGGGALLGAAFAVVYATVIDPRERLEKTQQEIAEWGDAWAEARACLVGAARSSDPTEAYVARELLDPDLVPGLRECVEPLKRLRRKPGDSTGDTRVEVRWSDLKVAIGELGTAHALRAAIERQGPESQLRQRLGKAIGLVDAAYARLRDAGELSAAEIPGGNRIPTGAPPAVLLANARFHHARDNAVFVRGEAESSSYTARIDGPARSADSRRPLAAATVVSETGPLWGVWLVTGEAGKTGDSLMAGPVDDAGSPAGDGVVIATAKPTEDIDGEYVAGDDHTRIIVYRVQSEAPDPELHLTRSTDQGATWTEIRTYPFGAHLQARKTLPRADLTWLENGRMHWLAIDARRLGDLEPVEVGPEMLSGPSLAANLCFGQRAAWWLLGGSVIYVGPDKKPTLVPGMRETTGIVQCDDDHLVEIHAVERRQARKLVVTRCRPAACDRSMELPLVKDALALATLGSNGASVAVATNGMVSIWSGNTAAGDPLTHAGIWRLPDGVEVHGLVDWDGELHVVSDRPDGVVTVRLAD